MECTVITNPILPAAGVRRNIAADGGAGPPSGGHYDDRASNPGIAPGRVLSDHSTPSNALMRCRRPFVMGTFNACTAREEARLMEVAHCAEEWGVEILGIQEHRIVHTNDPIVYRRVERCTFISASAWRNEAQAATGGVGLMLSSRARRALRRVYHHTDRILIAEFSGNPVTTVIVVYSPTNVASSEVVEVFFEDLATAVRDVPAHNFLAILGDFNARLGPEDVPFPYHDSTNRNGAYLTAFLTENELLAANTIFRKRTGKRWTFRDRATGMLRQLDYILVRRKWRNSIMNAEPYSTFSSVGSDHRVVSMRVRLSLRVPKPSPKVRWDWKAFTNDPGLQTRYAEEVRKRFQQLDQGADPSNEYKRFTAANEEATKLHVPMMERIGTSLRSRHPEVVAARGRVEDACLNYEREPTVERREELNEAKQRLFSTYDAIRGEEVMKKVQRVQAAQGDQKYGEAWRVINEMTGRKRTKEGQVEGRSPEERVTTWSSHFQRLLGETAEAAEEDVPSVLQDLGIEDGPFTAGELARAKATVKEGKSAGPDGIPPEVLKNCDLDDIILDFCNQALLNNRQPDMWSLSNIIPVPKAGDLSKPDNYRGISLTCIPAKVYNRMLLNRIRPAIDPHLRENQNGFREGRTTAAQILALRRIIEEVRKDNLTAVLCFIDFKKAFDSIHRGMMVKILKAYGIPPNLLRAIETMYAGTRAKVVTPDGNSEEFDILAGVMQGDTLAPFLFIIVLDYALRKAISGREQELGFTLTPRRSRRHPAGGPHGP